MAGTVYRRELVGFQPYVPGKPVEAVQREYGLESVEKLASNENPLGPSPMALKAMQEELENIHIYPDSTASKLREALGEALNFNPEGFVIGNGGEQLLQIIAQAFINEGDEAVMAETTFSLYESSVALMGGVAVKVPMKGGCHDLDGFLQAVGPRTKLMYICNPNNPTGTINTWEEIEQLICRLPETVMLVFDEAYFDYAQDHKDYPDAMGVLRVRPNTLILRTFSKIAGIAAIRVGYVVTAPQHAGQMSKIRGAFSVNSLAQAAALGSLKDRDHLRRTLALNKEAMDILTEGFRQRELGFLPSCANFIFVDVGMDAGRAFQELQRRGVIVRPGNLWGWNTWLRVSTGTAEQMHGFLQCLDAVLAES